MPPQGPFPLNLLVVTHVPHARLGGRLHAYAPYAREMAQWCRLCERVTIAAPTVESAPGGDWEAIDASNVTVRHVFVPSGTGVLGRVLRMACAPAATLQLVNMLRRADAVLVRCPGYLGFLGACIAPALARRRIAKYAGQWSAYAGESVSVKAQRMMLRSRWWGAPVLAYTSGEGEPPHVVPFFSAALSEPQMERARAVDRVHANWPPRRVLYVGRLSRNKNVSTLLRAVAALRSEGLMLSCVVVGDGSERPPLEALAVKLGLEAHVRFDGGLPLDEVLRRYEQSDILVLPSDTEGWPKSLAEGMAFGLLCIGPNRGIVPWMVAHGGGCTVQPGDVATLVAALRGYAQLTRGEWAWRSKAASEWGQRYTVEAFAREVAHVVAAEWRLRPGSESLVAHG